MLRLEAVDAFYGDLQALADVSFEVNDGEIVALVGANAAGKSTTLRVISGLVNPRRGRVLLNGDDLTGVPAHERVDHGIVQVPEGRRLFPFMTVAENLSFPLSVRKTGCRVNVSSISTPSQRYPRMRSESGSRSSRARK